MPTLERWEYMTMKSPRKSKKMSLSAPASDIGAPPASRADTSRASAGSSFRMLSPVCWRVPFCSRSITSFAVWYTNPLPVSAVSMPAAA